MLMCNHNIFVCTDFSSRIVYNSYSVAVEGPTEVLILETQAMFVSTGKGTLNVSYRGHSFGCCVCDNQHR
jgi:hypothetical protein